MVAIGRFAAGGFAPQTCEHLAPLERLLAMTGQAIGPGTPCPHDADWGVWFPTAATLDVTATRRQLSLDPCVHGEAYEDALSLGGDVTFYCTACKQAIVGQLHGRARPLR